MPKVKGPKDGKIVTASFDGKAKSRFPSLKDTKDLVLLSIAGNEFCQGEYLDSIVKQAVANHQNIPGGTSPAGKTTFLIADEIYWHNLKQLNSSRDVSGLKSEALSMGDNYFKKNIASFLAPLDISAEEFERSHGHETVDKQIAIINQLAIGMGKNFEIVRWQEWVAHDTTNKLKQMIPLYDSVEGLKDAIDETSEEFASRHGTDKSTIDLWRHRSHGYLTEECPSIMWLAAKLSYNFIIYPGAILPPLAATKEFFVVEEHRARIEKGESIKDKCTHSDLCMHVEDPSRLVNWLEVNFKRSHPPKSPVAKKAVGGPGFFPPKKERLPIDSEEVAMDEHRVVAHDSEQTSMVVRRDEDVLLSSLMDGVNRALVRNASKLPGDNRRVIKIPSSQLTQAFEGITKGIIKSDISSTEKIDLLAGLLNRFIQVSLVADLACRPTATSCQLL